MSQAFPLPQLRQELRVERGAPLAGGAPGWVLFDPLRHLFFQLGGLEQRVLAHWRLGEAHALCAALVDEGEDPDAAEDAIVAFHDFARANDLVARADAKALAARDKARPKGPGRWLLDHYLFIRIPLVRPAAFLARTLPVARLVWSRTGLTLLATLALLGLFMVARQWDAFTGQFAALMSGQGLLAYMAALLFVKTGHELGHAYMATRAGVRVPSMGVSFLVLMPVLYTDTSAAWRLRSRRARMGIDAAGIMAELSVAAVALFLWSFVPDGPVRTALFVLATTSLATSLLVNASPFMRFDGYYLLSDWLRVPNLAPRAFALMRWRLREALFGLGEAIPEPLSAGLRRTMLAYAVVTFAYRTSLYVGIALLVYHSTFKLLGIVLFLVEVSVFLARPVVAELKEWRARLPAIRASRRTRVTAGIAAALVVAAFLPLDRSVSVPALLTPIADQPVALGDPARVSQVLVRRGDAVAAGQPLVVLQSPEIDLGLAQARLRIAQLESRVARGVADRDDLADQTVLAQDLATERDRLAGFERRRAALTVRADAAGRVVDLGDDVQPGAWVGGRQPLLRVVSADSFDVAGFAGEDEAWRVAPGAEGRFVPDDASAGSWRVRLDEIGAAATTRIDARQLTQAGGALTTTGKDGTLAHAVTPLRLVAERGDASGFVQPVAGQVILPATGESLAAMLWRSLGRVMVKQASLG